MDFTVVLSEMPEKGNQTHDALYALWPRVLIYSIGITSRQELPELAERLKTTKDNAPFNGATKIRPVIPHFFFREMSFDELAAETVKLFPDVDMIYIDVRTRSKVEELEPMIETIRKMLPEVKIGILATSWAYMSDDSKILEYVKSKDYLVPCVFLSVGVSLEEQLKAISEKVGASTSLFCLSLSKEEKQSLADVLGKYEFELFAFWSPKAIENIDTKQISLEPKPAERPKEYVRMRALYTALVKRKKSINSDVLGHLTVGQVVDVHTFPPDADGTAWGEVKLYDGVGYVVVKHFGTHKLEEI